MRRATRPGCSTTGAPGATRSPGRSSGCGADPESRSATITTFQPVTDTAYVPCVSMLDFWRPGPGGPVELVVYAHSLDFGKKAYGNLVELARLQHRVAHGVGAASARSSCTRSRRTCTSRSGRRCGASASGLPAEHELALLVGLGAAAQERERVLAGPPVPARASSRRRCLCARSRRRSGGRRARRARARPDHVQHAPSSARPPATRSPGRHPFVRAELSATRRQLAPSVRSTNSVMPVRASSATARVSAYAPARRRSRLDPGRCRARHSTRRYRSSHPDGSTRRTLPSSSTNG